MDTTAFPEAAFESDGSRQGRLVGKDEHCPIKQDSTVHAAPVLSLSMTPHGFFSHIS
jgi:hypothetical protein